MSRANSVAVPSSSVFFQAWIWLAWTPNLLDSSATVPYSRIAARATFALNSGLCFFRVFDKSHLRPTGRSQAGLSLSYLSSFRGPPQYKGKFLCCWRGKWTGQKLKGKLVPGGDDWLLIRRDGVAILDARATVETHDAALIYLLPYNSLTDLGPDGNEIS